MPSRKHSSTTPRDGANGDAIASESVQAVPHNPEQFRRMVELVADGELSLPRHLPAEQLAALARAVRRHRRRRLVQYVARAVAGDILRARRSKHGG